MDITERKQAEEQLRQRAEELETVLDVAPMAIWISHDPLSHDITGNRMANAFYEAESGENVSANITPIRRFFHAGHELTADELPMQQASLANSEVRNVDLDVLLPSGAWLNMLGSASPLRDREGNVRGSVGTFMDITIRKQAEARLHASLHEKEVLLKEIHHRVKNNMQVISSLVSLQADTLDNPALQPLFNDLRDRVRTMALVHEKLYQSENLANIDFAEYMRTLLNYLWRAHGAAASNVRLTLDVHPVSLTVETAVPLGLLLNELVTNALKHAFRDRADAELKVMLHAEADGRVCLCVRDNGAGLPADWRQSSSLGLRLVQMLTGQVHGTLDVCSDGGTAFTLTFAPPRAS